MLVGRFTIVELDEIYIRLLEIFISLVEYLGINEKIIRIPRFIVIRPTHVYGSFSYFAILPSNLESQNRKLLFVIIFSIFTLKKWDLCCEETPCYITKIMIYFTYTHTHIYVYIFIVTFFVF